MYNISQTVQDGLKAGRYKKIYRFEVLDVPEKPAGYYEITRLAERQQYTIPTSGTYIFIGNAPSSWRGITTWEGGSEMDWIPPASTSPTTRYSGYFSAGDVISISGFDGISYVSVTTYMDAVPGVEGFTIDNNTLVAESVVIDERMCSGDTLKFGLCEGSSLEFQYFNHPNIKGRKIQAFIDVYYGWANTSTIPLGFFEVEKCSRQASTGIIKATCYNKLQSDYLNQNANDLIIQAYQEGLTESYINNVTVNYVLSKLLEDYAIDDYKNLTHSFVANANYCYVDSYNDEFQSIEYYMICPIICRTSTSYSNIVSGYNRIIIANLNEFKTALAAIIADQYGADFALEAIDHLTQLKIKYKHNNSILTYSNNPFLYPNNGADPLQTPLIEDVVCNDWNDYTAYFVFNIPIRRLNSSSDTPTAQDVSNAFSAWNNLNVKVERQNQNAPLGRTVVDSSVENWQAVTLRQLQAAVFESGCMFGALDRETDLFKGVSLPSGSSQLTVDATMYSQLWADEGNVHKWRYLIITYKGLDENNQEKDFTLQRTVNADGTDDYNCSDNWLFRNLVWTSADIGNYADTMANNMRGVTWFPFELWCAGLPYMETGDKITIPYNGTNYTSYILQRQLKGIQGLQDTYINGTLDIF